jgi:hypothetical protein
METESGSVAVVESSAPVTTESSSVEASSPPAELGASGQGGGAGEGTAATEKVVTQRDLDRFKASIQSSFDKQLSKLQTENSGLKSRIGAMSVDLEFAQAKLRAPDPSLQPDEASKHWEKEALKHSSRARTEMFIAQELLSFAHETGVVVTRDDARLDVSGGPNGAAKFKASLDRIKNEKADAERRQKETADQRAQIEAEVRQKLMKELGVTSFDAGQPTSSGGALTLESYNAMSSQERMKLKKENPQLVNQMVARAAGARI